MKVLTDILKGITLIENIGDLSVSIGNIQFDSRKVQPGDLFVAVKGSHVDGHLFINTAIEKGAFAVVCEQIPVNYPPTVVMVRIANTQRMFGIMASNFYGDPTSNLKVVGVTGTNGKTTIATLLYNTFTLLGYKVGLISTIKYYVGKDEFHATHTTPDALQIQELMAKMVGAGCTYCFMEVSSHAVDQERISGIKFDGGIFTNLTHDHLDYHVTFAEYLKAKKRFFDQLPSSAFALTNGGCKNVYV